MSTPQPSLAKRPWAYSAFPVTVRAIRRLSPKFLRVTFFGDALQHFAPWGLDQRIKLVLPMPGDAPRDFRLAEFGLLEQPTPHPSDWYQRWRLLPEGERNVLRTYTPAAIRPEVRELDVDVFIHEPAGPASAWALAARPGDHLVITGPDARNGWTGYGIHWQPETHDRFLIVADETAFPAARNIVASLPPGAEVDLLLDIDDPADDLVSGDFAVTGAGAASGRADTGTAIASDTAIATVRLVVAERGTSTGPNDLTGVERAVRRWGAEHGATARDDPRWFVWLAGESGATTRIRRYLTSELGIAKDRIAFLGYWRIGGALVG
ncbi:siderophore-interacting protein [Leucobacter japonicus]|uniref:siderophore-interacting protein n=1 Tax=Leucobacter japonicus TaxID=1461259 RepID=UPI0006A79D9A|nr:siderophore-interacting protein [Leucobacter japonicus]